MRVGHKETSKFLLDHTNEHILTDVDCCISAVYREPYEGTGQIEGVQLRRAVPIETCRRGFNHISAVPQDGAFPESERSYWGLAGGKKGL